MPQTTECYSQESKYTYTRVLKQLIDNDIHVRMHNNTIMYVCMYVCGGGKGGRLMYETELADSTHSTLEEFN